MRPAAAHAGHIEVAAVVVRIGAKTLLGPLDARFAVGRLSAVLGPNGAGKSTLLSVLAQWSAPHAGAVHWHGQRLVDIAGATLARWRAVLPQHTELAFDFNVRELVELGRLPHRRQPSANEAGIVDAVLDTCEVRGLAARSLSSLSGGERARVYLARALAQVWEPPADGAPRWLLLDEPTAALDIEHQHALLALVRRCAIEQGMGVIAVLHDPNLALRYADDALVLAGGEVAAHGPARDALTPALMRSVFRVHCESVSTADAVPQLLLRPEATGQANVNARQ